jgi:hypothetical protein
MKRFFTALVMIAAMATWVSAQNTTAQDPAEPQDGGPVMTFESTEIDYGTIEQGSEPYRYFKFTNTGDEALVIENAKGSCGCTVPTWPKEPILPGETSEIKVKYDTKRIGRFTKSITLTTNEAVKTRVLRIKGEVQKKPEEPAGVPASSGGFNK